jgi:succinyl-diaminopimelate desuccinylase
VTSHPRESVVETLLWFLATPSFIGEEGPLCDKLVERLASVEKAAPVRRWENSVVVPLSRGTGGPKIVLAGHLDVVRTSHDGEPRIEGDRIYGPGAADMKSGLAVMLELAEHHREAFARHLDLTLVFYSKEEGPFADNELGIVLDRDPELRDVDLAVCLEPSDNKLSLGASGSIHAKLIFEGRTSHSARPWQGDNAIHRAGPLLSDLLALPPRDALIDGLTYRGVFSVTMASGGRGRNVVPDRFELNLNHRFPPDRSIEQAQADIEALVGGRARIEWFDLSPSAPPFAEHALVRRLIESGVKAIEPKQAWTDVARFASLGIPAVNFGPGDNAQAHQRNEHTSLPNLLEGQSILLRWFASLVSQNPSVK